MVGSLAQLMKLEDAGVKRSMLHAMTVLFKRQPGLFSSAFTANDGEAKVDYHCAVPLCLLVLHLVRGSENSKGNHHCAVPLRLIVPYMVRGLLSGKLSCSCWAACTLLGELLSYPPLCRRFCRVWAWHLGRAHLHQSCSPLCRSSDH